MIGRDLDFPFAQRSLADVQFQIAHDPPVGLGEFINSHLSHADFRQHLIRLDGITVVGGGKSIDKHLPQLFIDAAGKLSGRELDQAARIGDLDPNRPLVRDTQPTAVPERADRCHAQRFRPHGKSAERGLRFDDDLPGSFDRAAELHFQASHIAILPHRPAEHGIAGNR